MTLLLLLQASRMPYRVIVLAIVFLCSQNVISQKEKDDCLGSWLVLVGTHTISNKLSVPTVGILRNYEFLHHYEYVFFRTGLTYKVNSSIKTTLGYAYLDTEPFIESPEAQGAQQHWLYEQISHNAKIGILGVTNRLRIENRWNISDETKLTHRSRYRLQLTHPICNRLYLKSFNEVFVNLPDFSFNQNRLYIGVGYAFSPNVSMDMGYVKNRFNDIAFDRLRIGLVFKTDLRKK